MSGVREGSAGSRELQKLSVTTTSLSIGIALFRWRIHVLTLYPHPCGHRSAQTVVNRRVFS